MNNQTQIQSEHESAVNKNFFLIFALLIFLLTINMLFWLTAKRYINQQAETYFNERVSSSLSNLRFLIHQLEDQLNYGQRFFYSSDNINRNDFVNFYTDGFYELEKTFKGLKTIAFIRKVENLPQFISNVRSDRSVSNGHYYLFDIFPKDKQEQYYIVDYLVPFNKNRELFGYVVNSVPEQEQYLLRAITLQQTVISDLTYFLNEKVIVIYKPIYQNYANKQNSTPASNATGLLALIINPEELFCDLCQLEMGQANIWLNIYDNNTLLYEENTTHNDLLLKDKSVDLKKRINFPIANKVWTLEFLGEKTKQISPIENMIPNILFALGSFLSLIIFYLSGKLLICSRKESNQPHSE